MTESFSITIDRDLIARLQSEICCSHSQSTCLDNEFCSSDPAGWPTITNGNTKVRLAYPEEDDSVPGIEGFADAYIRWHAESGCGVLAHDVAKIAYRERGNQLLMLDTGANGVLSLFPVTSQNDPICAVRANALQGNLDSIRKAVYSRCSVMFDEVKGDIVFNEDRAEDLDNLATLSSKVQLSKSKASAATGGASSKAAEYSESYFSWRSFS